MLPYDSWQQSTDAVRDRLFQRYGKMLERLLSAYAPFDHVCSSGEIFGVRSGHGVTQTIESLEHLKWKRCWS